MNECRRAARSRADRWLRSVAKPPQRAARRVVSWLGSPEAASLLGEPFFRLLGRRDSGEELDLTQVKSALVVRLDEMGDMVMTTPFLRELRRNLPHAWITLAVKPAVQNLVELCPHVNEVLTYDWNVQGRLWQLQRHRRALRLARRSLWRRRFDLAVLPRWDADNSHATFVLYFSGAPRRVGYSTEVIEHKRRLNRGFDRLLTHPWNDGASQATLALKHEVERSLDLIRFMGGTVQEEQLELWLGEEDRAFAEALLAQRGVRPGELLVGFGPSGGNSPLKQWPASRFAELGRWLQAEYGARVLIVGGPREKELGREIEGGLGPLTIDVTGKTTLRQMAALLERCQVYVGNDTGPTHVAAATGNPVVAIFGASCHHRFGPWAKGSTILSAALPCGPCSGAHHLDRCVQCVFERPRCLPSVPLEQVKAALSEQIGRVHAAPAGATAEAPLHDFEA